MLFIKATKVDINRNVVCIYAEKIKYTEKIGSFTRIYFDNFVHTELANGENYIDVKEDCEDIFKNYKSLL